MRPAISPGEMLSVEPVRISDLAIGDVLVVNAGGDWIVHRLVGSWKSGQDIRLLLKGDNARTTDEAVSEEQIVGRVTTVARNNAAGPHPVAPEQITMDAALLRAVSPASDQITPPTDITAGTGWPDFAHAACREGLGGLLHSRASSSVRDLPTDTAKQLKRRYVTTAARNTLFFDTLDGVCDALGDIDVILLKGAYLAAHVYENIGCREFSDIDLLVRDDDVARLYERLGAIGYSTPHPYAKSAYLNSAMFKAHDVHVPLHVHWSLQNSIMPKYAAASWDNQSIWDRAQRTDSPYLNLSPEHLVLHLSEHAVRHSFERLALLQDIAEVIAQHREQLDWNRVLDNAQRAGLAPCVYYALAVLECHGCCAVGPNVLSLFRPTRQGTCGRAFLKLAAAGRRAPELCNLAYLDNASSPRAKLAFVRHSLFPPRSALAQAYATDAASVGFRDYAARLWRGMFYAITAARGPSSGTSR